MSDILYRQYIASLLFICSFFFFNDKGSVVKLMNNISPHDLDECYTI